MKLMSNIFPIIGLTITLTGFIGFLLTILFPFLEAAVLTLEDIDIAAMGTIKLIIVWASFAIFMYYTMKLIGSSLDELINEIRA